MKNIKTAEIKKQIKKLLVKASFELPEDILGAIRSAKLSETSKTAISILDMIIANADTAYREKLPLCQDCGTVYINMDIGPDICITDKSLSAALNEGHANPLLKEIDQAVEETYRMNYLRASILSDPLYERKNTGTNLPAVINVKFSDIKGLYIEVCLKGGGSENCSWLFMLNPAAEEDEILQKVISLIKSDATKACPPVIIGVGIGSTASEVTKLARKAAFRNLSKRNNDKRYAALEEKILQAANKTGVGPQGLGGKTTALACNIEFAPCHMATLPVSIFFGCHSTRRASIIL
ncbi:MAG: fumarate hydratase [Actinobacteria bacterium]|nr:fumarate hydratase [Actinomycetota bacterium]